MRALVVEHAEHEGAGLVGDALAEGGMRLHVVRTWAGDALPSRRRVRSRRSCSAASISANDPALDGEAALLAESSRAGRPTVGICLGAQLLARGLGARVYRGDAPEIGLYPLSLNDAGQREPLLAGLDGARVLHWHNDTFELPAGATLLASSARYAHQAFRVGRAHLRRAVSSRVRRAPCASTGRTRAAARRLGIDPRRSPATSRSTRAAARSARALLQLVGVREQV